MTLGIVPREEIEVGDRWRKDYGDIEELAISIKEKGLINPITVSTKESGGYILAAGGRRMTALDLLEWKEIPCRIYDHPLNDLELLSIELEENIRRKDLTPGEDCRLKRELLLTQQKLYGEKVSTSPGAPGVSMRDVARLVGVSQASMSLDVSLAETMEAFPDIDWSKCKTKSDAVKIKNKIEEVFLRGTLASRAEEAMGKSSSNAFQTKLMNAYIVGDFFEEIQSIPGGCIDLVEIDPPYAIDLTKQKKDYAYDHEKYNEIDIKDYPTFMQNLFKECYRVMAPNSWLLCWFGPDPWFEDIYQWISKAGFSTRRLTAKWIKPTGQTNQPSKYLANSDEQFYYASKGTPILARQGRTNIFQYNPVPSARKFHPTERPLEMMDDVLTTFAMEGSRVLVPFLGSGNTLISAARNKMVPFGFDLTEAYRNSYILKVQEMFGSNNDS